MGQIDITDFVTNLINSITDEKIINKADKTYVDDNFVLNTLFEEQINLKSDIDHNHDDRYYTESEMDIKLSEIESSIVGASGFSVSIVDVLPESGEFNTIYLVPSESPTENNKYNNYIWTGTEYDEIGGASPADIDLSDYATLEYLTSELSKYATIATLNTELSKKANNDHTHDTRYYTESEVDDLFTQLNDILETKSDVGHTHIIDDISNLQSTLDNKAPSSHVHSRLVPTSIPEGADLNDYTTQGSFYCSANTIATTIQNSPSNQAFHLEVYKTADLGVRQVVYAFSTSNTYSWQRNGYNGNWTNWCEIIDINKVDSSLSSTSTNPVQNKIITQEILNLENAESNLDTIVNDGGGTNLLPYTKDFRDSYYDTTSALTGETYRGLAIRKLDNTAGSEKGYQDLIDVGFNAGNFNYGETFTLSFWLRGDTEGDVDDGPVNTYFYGEPGYVTTSPIKSSDGFTKGFSDGQCKLGITNEWRRVYVTYKLNTTGSLTTNKKICIRVYDGYSIEVCGLKLEKGSIPSDWSPAPEDCNRIITLGTNVDFNDYKTEGTYVISWTNAQSATNVPNKSGGRLEVISIQNGVKQIYHNYRESSSGLKIWWRNYYPTNDTWFDWQEIISTNNVDTVLSSTSTKPVQNKVIYSAIGDIKTALNNILGA